jgi:hypothetical protein
MEWIDIRAGEGINIDIIRDVMTISADATPISINAGTGIEITANNTINIKT